MKTADLKPKTAYATCDGQYVVPLAPVHARWAKDANGKFIQVNPQAQNDGADPWGGCHRRNRVSSRARAIGVRVEVHGTDRDGKSTGKTHEDVMRPQDIGGLWTDYAILYADIIQKRADDRAAEDRRKQAAADLRAAVSARFGALATSVEISTHVPWRDERGPRERRYTFRVEVPENNLPALKRLLRPVKAGK